MKFILLLLLLTGRKIAQIGQTESRSRTMVLQEAKFILFRDSFSYNDIFFFGFFTFSFFEKIHNLF